MFLIFCIKPMFYHENWKQENYWNTISYVHFAQNSICYVHFTQNPISHVHFAQNFILCENKFVSCSLHKIKKRKMPASSFYHSKNSAKKKKRTIIYYGEINTMTFVGLFLSFWFPFFFHTMFAKEKEVIPIKVYV